MTRRLRGAAGALLVLVACETASPQPAPSARSDPPTPAVATASSAEPSPSPSAASSRSPQRASGFEPIVLAESVGIPIGLSLAPDGRLFFAQVKEGLIRVIAPETGLQPEPVARIEVAAQGEFGLVGLTLDPAFETNHFMYANFTVPGPDGEPVGNRVVRLVERDGVATVDLTLIDDIPPAEGIHVAGRLAFGPDGMLYVAVGDTQRPDEAQDPDAVVGRILRIAPDGSIPPDNPIPGSRTFAFGFRNPFGLAFDQKTGDLYAVDNGPASYDEVNRVEPGGNYGHPINFGPSDGRFVDPLWHSGEDSHGMSGIAVVRGSPVPAFDDRVLFCTVDDGLLHSLAIRGGAVGEDEPIDGVRCTFDVTPADDGGVYVASESIVHLRPVYP